MDVCLSISICVSLSQTPGTAGWSVSPHVDETADAEQRLCFRHGEQRPAAPSVTNPLREEIVFSARCALNAPSPPLNSLRHKNTWVLTLV